LPDYERVSSPPPEEEDIDLDDPDQWSHWRDNRGAEVFLRRLRDALQFNTFSTFSGQDIPLARSRIASAVANSPEILLAEAIGFAIMGRNEKLLFELLDHDPSEMDLTGLYPFHLAANYLEGSEACCNIFTILVPAAVGRNHIKNLHVNDFGHTVLDSLMMAILKSHTSCTPVMVDERLKKTQRFVGEDVDMCGRWDADSHCVRAANANGSSRVPFSWKHMFCHTSAQAICHAIPAIFGKPYSPDINTPSGLFTKSCSKCDMRLVPSPLHSLILTAFHLAQYGCEGENLFGILACLVCLLACGADSTIRVQMSAGELLGASNGTECDHCPIDPAQLGEQVPHEIRSGWTDEVKLGWDTILVVLRVAQQERYPSRERVQGDGQEMYFDFDGFDPSTGGGYDSAVAGHHALGGFGPGNEEEDGEERASHVEEGCEHFADEHSSDDNFCFGSKGLGTLWAAIQVELLTYRRLKDGDPWHSDRFNMRMVRDADKNCGGFLDLPLVKGEMLKPFCKCGRFEDARNHDIPTTEEACTFYFSNLEDWNRTNFLNVPYPDN
jgi:hypothetical protein